VTTDFRVEDRYRSRTPEVLDLIERGEPAVWSRAEGPLDATALAGHEARGYSTFDGLLSPAEVRAYRLELGRLAGDAALKADERTVVEKESDEVRSIFEVHRISELVAELVTDPRVLDRPGRSSAPRSTCTRAGSTTCPASGAGVSTGTRTSRPGTPKTGCRCRAR